MVNISGVVLAKNEEENIRKCIKSLSFCSEVLVIDDYSSDTTRKIAKKLGAKVYKRKLADNFSDQRNFALKKTKGDWILFVDADEVVNRELKEEIASAVETKIYNGYFLKRLDNIWGKDIKYGEAGNVRLLRLAKNNKGKWIRGVHEKWDIEGKTKDLENPLIHYPHQNIREFIEHINYFSSLHALENAREGKKASLFNIIFMPPAHFTRNYFLRLGFLDGTRGFILAFLMSFHSFLSWSKLYLKK